jgi:hypothetical protein
VRILFSNQSGKKVGYQRSGESFTEITTVCQDDSQSIGDALSTDGDCKINVSSDLVVWTKHFTKFATYTQVSSSSGSSGTTASSVGSPACNRTVPKAPRIFSITNTGFGKVQVIWGEMENTDSWTLGYGLQLKNYTYGIHNFGDKNSRSIEVSGLGVGRYYFALRANNGCQPGPFSPEWMITIKKSGIISQLTTSIAGKLFKTTVLETARENSNNKTETMINPTSFPDKEKIKPLEKKENIIFIFLSKFFDFFRKIHP